MRITYLLRLIKLELSFEIPALAKSFASNLAKGLMGGEMLDFALWSGMSTGSMLEALVGELFNTDKCEDECSVK